MEPKQGPGEITQLLHQWGKGDHDALKALFPKVHQHLRALASGYFRRESREDILQATGLVHEVYLQIEGKTLQFEDSDHFFRVIARMMRRMLTSRARARKSQKRGGDLNESLENLDAEPANIPLDLEDLIILEEALSRLEKRFPRLVRIVELRVFVGLQNAEISQLLNISTVTVKRDWVEAKRRLYLALSN